jgi:hypothetical protein
MRGTMVPPDFFDEVVRLRNEYRKSSKAPQKVTAPPKAPPKRPAGKK